jgi:hypothetical protein
LAAAAVAGLVAVFAGPAQGAGCPANANGVAHSGGPASHSCPVAKGRKAGDATGRKVG